MPLIFIVVKERKMWKIIPELWNYGFHQNTKYKNFYKWNAFIGSLCVFSVNFVCPLFVWTNDFSNYLTLYYAMKTTIYLISFSFFFGCGFEHVSVLKQEKDTRGAQIYEIFFGCDLFICCKTIVMTVIILYGTQLILHYDLKIWWSSHCS